MSALTSVLVSLYEEADKPTDVIGYIQRHIANAPPLELQKLADDNEALRRERIELVTALDEAQDALAEARRRIVELEGDGGAAGEASGDAAAAASS